MNTLESIFQTLSAHPALSLIGLSLVVAAIVGYRGRYFFSSVFAVAKETPRILAESKDNFNKEFDRLRIESKTAEQAESSDKKSS